MMLKTMSWADLGRKDLEGQTQALIFKSLLTEKSNKDGFEAYRDNDPVEHSIRMQYVKIGLAINSDHEDFVNEKAEWDKIYPLIANKERADALGYFYPVYEAKIYKEGSMVLAGSNDATPTLYDLKEPATSSSKTKPPTSTTFNVSEAIEKLNINL
jgi:disulfide oxidoreductase YuzD